MSDWRTRSLSDLALEGEKGIAGGPFGSSLGRKHYVPYGVPVIRGGQLAKDRQFSLTDLVFVSEEKADRHLGNLAYPGDVVVTQRGTLGQVGLIPSSSPYERFLLSQSQMKITVNPSVADGEFLYYLLRGPEVSRRLADQALTTGVPHINLAILREFKVSLPEVRTQRRIASFLSAFDLRIKLNERRIELLEDLSRSLYTEWFVRFRFPGHSQVKLAESVFGFIPERWEVRRGSDVFEINPRIKSSQNSFEKIGMADLHERFSYAFPSSTVDRRTGTSFERDDVLLARITPCLENGKTALIKCLDPGEMAIGSTEFIVLRSINVGPAFTYCFARDERVREHAIKSMSGSSGRQRVAVGAFESLRCVEPSIPIAQAFEEKAGPMLEQVFELQVHCRTLAATRDLLLPRLVTGRLDITDLDLDSLLSTVEAA